MAERYGRVSVSPARGDARVSSTHAYGSDSPAERAPRVELVPVRRGTRWDAPLIRLGLAALLVALVKPWPSGTERAQTFPAEPALVARASATPTPTPTPEPPIVLPALALDARAGQCFEETGWQICLLGNAAGQEIHSRFNPDRLPGAGQVAQTLPVALLLTRAGAGLGFYAPTTGTTRMAPGAFVSAWRTDGSSGRVEWLQLRALAPPDLASPSDTALSAGLYLASSEPLVSASQWPLGRYDFLLKATDGSGREEYFAVEVASASASASGPAASEDPRRGLHFLFPGRAPS